jgi:putative transcriptional regulator
MQSILDISDALCHTADKRRRLHARETEKSHQGRRAEKNLSQEQLAVMAGVSRQTIGSIETGQYCPTARLALVLSKCLNKSFEELFYLEEEYDHA